MITPDADWDPLRTLNDLAEIVSAQSNLVVDLAQDIRTLKQQLQELREQINDLSNTGS